MLSDKEVLLLRKLRQNSRLNISALSKETSIPASTLFDILKKLETKIVKKHVSLVDFSKIGYNLRLHMVINSNKKSEIINFLSQNQNVNTLSTSINNDLIVECLFKDLKQMTDFKENIEIFKPNKFDQTFILEEIKKEEFSI